jgi:hypothetical protein
MLNIVCTLWGDWADGLGAEYAIKLRNSVARNLTLEHKFFCIADELNQAKLTDSDLCVLKMDNPSRLGIIPKLAVYNPAYGFEGRIVVMDLDTLVLGSLDDMFSYSGEFCVRKAYLPKIGRKFSMIGGDLLAFPAGFGEREIWDKLISDTKAFEADSWKGDERRIYDRRLIREEALQLDFWQDLYPGQYRSFKFNNGKDRESIREKLPLKNTRLVSFHGKPRIHQVTGISWVEENWK